MLLPDDRCPAPHRHGKRRFCPLSLGDWIGAAAAANVPMVDARRIATFERDDLLKHDCERPHRVRGSCTSTPTISWHRTTEARVLNQPHATPVQLAPLSTLPAAGFSPSCASETTRRTPQTPRRTRLRGNACSRPSPRLQQQRGGSCRAAPSGPARFERPRPAYQC